MTITVPPSLNPPAPRDRPRPTWAPSRELLRNLLGAFGIGGALIGVIGFAVSFLSVSNAARPYFGDAAWTLPVLVDLGIFTLSGLAVALELHEISSKLIRLIPNLLALFTVYLNTATQHTLFGKAVHAAGPLLWITVVEIGTYTVRRLVGLSSDNAMDKVRASRWFLAPVSTFRLWRRMRLWEIRDYREAIGREHAMSASRALLREWHGPRWRHAAPSAQRLAVRLQATTVRPVAEILTDAAAGIMAAQAAAVRPVPAEKETSASVAEVFAADQPDSVVLVASQLMPVNTGVVDEDLQMVDPIGRDADPHRLSTKDAADVIRLYWATGHGVTETAKAATRDKGYVSRQFAAFEREATRPAPINGHSLTETTV